MEGLLKEIVDLYRRGEEAVLVTLCSTKGSTPRKAGAKMLVYPDGKIKGTIGGGELEYRAINKALEVMKKKESILWETELIELEMVCGGVCTLYLEYLNSSSICDERA
ncbi:MAG: XdhC family protein [Thermacetogeniaceae bacterium]|jgi:xanthine dehydrogenase accessory factor|nr:XdhC family protein [Syntrophomonadaceae bacterium]